MLTHLLVHYLRSNIDVIGGRLAEPGSRISRLLRIRLRNDDGVFFSALLRLLGGCLPPDTSSPISHDAQCTLSTPASISPDAHCFSYLHSAHRRRSLAALICTNVHRFLTKMSALCTGDDDDDDDQISSYFLPGKTLSEYLVNGIMNIEVCEVLNKPNLH
jgi:hypothetical protein